MTARPAGLAPVVDLDGARATLHTIRTRTELPVSFVGLVDADRVILSGGVGLRTTALDGLPVARGAGLGGHVLRTGRPTAVTDYSTAGITQHYHAHVAAEGLRSMVAMPLTVNHTVRAVFYAADRRECTLGDTVLGAVSSTVRELAQELRIREEVERRVQYAEAAAAERTGLGGVDRELLREVFSELRTIAGEIADGAVRARLESACGRISRLGRHADEAPPERPLTAREVDVLAQVALGCTNAEVAQRLSIGAETVKAYLRSAGQKLGTRTRFESVTRARSLGLLP
ncbi:Transcriptional regulator, LuxR family OS=Tsukamurella paurometabola (strain ATCC 8368 / DSM/ CCUG 35730 / CIP 100753 / JCM 10117 / KCTC 9821 / NBRC 16120/ NCIMB 702349 / NCTC 13040) OX=521096 GN=Tpau_3743 PE=4 SV=1 [Tsukamurella paurometabola]|uniref:Transcriptional regulator, LuxR family n=1 Tax=Tsukamurella paurometabola (strain ATCC 8368 / DSM 20162 / CCUG 35730 / CIP 100753 / JCM 10117 / KCTC 9821 / NBRC 16120 / NCIMB 702349 / NCTC 13040) TaxID=521096 RepID=D5UYL8_TSUPD|nr:LuxR C-terminal-related transcriptional regulator [Tsukamurella paurometabola]ADG80321.1 transcriptional regulator, LuxR family [Tsukamurella paurometabola DSM 20162]SUP39243.1 HTH-type quorum sensing-dependent transcriptional regulator vjbR [Tsukamurella paurometabola]